MCVLLLLCIPPVSKIISCHSKISITCTTQRIQNATTTISGKGRDRRGCARKSASTSKSTTISTNDGVGIVTRQREIRENG